MSAVNLLIGWIKLLVLLLVSTTGVCCYATTIIYVANADSQDISVFQWDDKKQQAKLMQTFPVGGAVMPMTVSPDQQHLYAAIRFEPYRVIVMAIDPTTGKLSQTASVPLVDNMANISLDARGDYLLATSYSGNKISVQPLDNNGIPLRAAQVIATGAHPHQITTSSDNRFVYVSLLGDARLDYFTFKSKGKNAAAHPLKPIAKTARTFMAGSGPRHFIFSDNENFLYVLDELRAMVHVLKRDAKTGEALLLESHRLLSVDAPEQPWAADIHMTPNGKFLYASERNSSSLSGFKINTANGRLSAIGRWNTEQQPRAFSISPDGRFLASVGQKSHSMTLYVIHPDTGALELVDRQPTGKNPAWVEIVSLPEAGVGSN